MKRIVPIGLWLAMVAAASAVDLSVNAVTDFLSDVKTAIAACDRNGDGQLNRDELGSRSWMLLAMDKNHDGQLSEDELRAGVGLMSRKLFNSRAAAPSTELAPPLVRTPEPVRGPQPVRGADYGIGRLIADASLTTLDGKEARAMDFAGSAGTVFAVLSTSCPVSKKYLPVLARLEKEYAGRGVKFVGVAGPGEDDVAALRATGLAGPVLRDMRGDFLRALGATRSTDVFAMDAAHTLVYRGAVDDQYGLGYNLDAPRERLLSAALEALLADQRPVIPATEAPGCELEFPTPAKVATADVTPATWHGRISRLLQENCVTCHRDGGLAPFAFETYEQVLKKAGTIRRVVTEGVMPPWFTPNPPAGQHTAWLNDASLSPQDKADLLNWLANGRPEGDPNRAARPRAWPEGWAIGHPDQIVQIPQPVAVKAEGTMPYQSIMVDPGLTEDKWISAWEVRPTARQNVHHVLIYIYPPNDWSPPGSEERRGQLANYVPGNSVAMYPEGFAKALPKGAKLRFEIHYTPNGKATEDQTMLGLRFSSKPEHVVEVVGVANLQLRIPPGEAAYPQAASVELPSDARLLSLMPHMHVRGKAMRFEVLTPSGETHTLLDLPRYDFNWQIPVRYAEPPLVTKGSKLRVTGWFDNSADNKANPNPGATVRWGSQTDDEMMIGYIEYYRVK